MPTAPSVARARLRPEPGGAQLLAHEPHARALLNFIDPIAIGLPALDIDAAGLAWRVSGALEHSITSFGGDVALNAFAQAGELDVFAALHAFLNHDTALPGVTLQVVRYPVHLGLPLRISPRLELWLQPEDQAFRTTTPRPGALLETQAATALVGPLEAFVTVDGKTPGWVSDHPVLGASADVLAGLSLLL